MNRAKLAPVFVSFADMCGSTEGMHIDDDGHTAFLCNFLPIHFGRWHFSGTSMQVRKHIHQMVTGRSNVSNCLDMAALASSLCYAVVLRMPGHH